MRMRLSSFVLEQVFLVFVSSNHEVFSFHIADAMISTGLSKVGYKYINIDDYWAEQNRDAQGNLVSKASTFPSDMKSLADYVHSKGLKLGIYTDAGILVARPCQALLDMRNKTWQHLLHGSIPDFISKMNYHVFSTRLERMQTQQNQYLQTYMQLQENVQFK